MTTHPSESATSARSSVCNSQCHAHSIDWAGIRQDVTQETASLMLSKTVAVSDAHTGVVVG
jgi:hypothetical protein